MTHRLARLVLITAFCLGLGLPFSGCKGCGDKDADAESLRQAAQAYWQAHKEGDWPAVYRSFSPEFLKRRRLENPDMFKSLEAYTEARRRFAVRHPYNTIEVLSVTLNPDKTGGTVQTGIRIRGKSRRTLVTQQWTWDGQSRRWLLLPDIPPAR